MCLELWYLLLGLIPAIVFHLYRFNDLMTFCHHLNFQAYHTCLWFRISSKNIFIRFTIAN